MRDAINLKSKANLLFSSVIASASEAIQLVPKFLPPLASGLHLSLVKDRNSLMNRSDFRGRNVS